MKLPIDWELFKQQKKTLIGLLIAGKADQRQLIIKAETDEALTGILHLLDGIQDQYLDGHIDSWLETYHEIVATLYSPAFQPLHDKIREEGGRTALWAYAEQLTNDFQERTKAVVWDGQFFETIDSYMQEQLKAI